MGITGLLPQLKSIMTPLHIKELQGCSVAVDTYSWLHKGALSCSTQLCKGIPTTRHIDYCMHRVNLLRHYGVKPVLVFDGGHLPMKTDQENKRARSRKENLARAIEHESSGNSSAAYECYQKAVDISPAIAYELIQVLKQESISYVVAPYEADAQMTFLAITNQVEAVITEDSDLIAFGCPRIIYKMDKYGQGVQFQFHMLSQNKDLSFMGFTSDMVLEMCILSGCDYLPSLPGMGLKRAHALISKFKTFQKVIKHLRYSSVAVPPLYEESFKKAVWTFQHQRVYDPNKEDIVYLSNMSEDFDGDLDFLGPSMPQYVVKAIAYGDLDPISKVPFQGTNDQNPALNSSYKLKSLKTEKDEKKLDLPAQKNVLTNYFCFASLEAKRKFRAPRVSPMGIDFANESSPTTRKQERGDSDYRKRNDSSESLLGVVLSSSTTLPQNPVQGQVSQKEIKDLHASLEGGGEQNPLNKFSYSIPKPCTTLRRGRDDEPGSSTILEKTHQHAVGSSYLQQNTLCETGVDSRSYKATLRSSYFLDKAEDNNLSRANNKVIVRSSYFKHKPNKTTTTHENSSFLLKGSSSNGGTEKIIPVMKSIENNQYEDLCMKRKLSPSHIDTEEHVENKRAFTEAHVEAKSATVLTDDDKPAELMQEEEKFGCRISHLGQYSDISEKSMDKFVSVISSFRFSSSGSRASGLRAPLKDVKNSCHNRTAAQADIGNFSYVPKSGKVPRAPMRRK